MPWKIESLTGRINLIISFMILGKNNPMKRMSDYIIGMEGRKY